MNDSPSSIRMYFVVFVCLALFAGILGAKADNRFIQGRFYLAEKYGSSRESVAGEIRAAINAMKRKDVNGSSVWEELEHVEGTFRTILIAVAMHESNGDLSQVAHDKGTCAFQITPDPRDPTDTVYYAMSKSTYWPTIRGKYGMTGPATAKSYIGNKPERDAYMLALVKDARLCTEAGFNVVAEKFLLCQRVKGGKYAAHVDTCALCAFGNQWRGTVFAPARTSDNPAFEMGYFVNGEHYDDHFRCPASEEIRIILSILAQIEQGLPLGSVALNFVPNDDPNSKKYGQTTVYVAGEKITDILMACADSTLEIARTLAQASKSYQAATVLRVRDYYTNALQADQQNPATNLRGNMKNKQCLSSTLTFFQTIRNLISGTAGIVNMILALINSLLQQVCNYVATAINNALASVCIPLPSLSLSLSLPSMASSTCNGLSLLNVMQMGSNTNGPGMPPAVAEILAPVTIQNSPMGMGTGMKRAPTTTTSDTTTTGVH